MPKIACPQCKKRYDVPEQTLGRVATCKCGKKFRLGNKPAVVPSGAATGSEAKSTPQPKRQPKPKPVAAPVVEEPPIPSDSFWDDALAEPTAGDVGGASMLGPTSPAPATPPAGTTATPAAGAKPAKKKKKRKKSGGVRWGADWAKVGGGLATFAIAGGITVVLVFTTGYLFYWPAGIAIVGLFTALTGLMGEEGIW